MKREKEVKISNWASHLTTGVSVTLALLTIGIIAFIWIAATSESRKLKEKIELSVVLADSIGENRALAIYDALKSQPFTLQARYISKEEAMKNWKESTGEDLERTFGVNPLSPEIAFTLKSDYTSAAALAKIEKSVSAIPGVAEVGAPDSAMIESMNRNIERLTIGLGILAAVMLIISFVLINNTVRLSIYSRRFTIHTMQLVGATNGFIRRPFVVSNLTVGIFSGLIAAGIIALLMWGAPEAGLNELQEAVGWTFFGILACGLILAGGIICALAATMATTRHLHQDYDELFK